MALIILIVGKNWCVLYGFTHLTDVIKIEIAKSTQVFSFLSSFLIYFATFFYNILHRCKNAYKPLRFWNTLFRLKTIGAFY